MAGFKPLLAEAPEPRFPLRFPMLGSPKYDGIRCINLDGFAVSRKLKPIPNTGLRAVLEHPYLRNIDGELLAGSPTHPNAMQATTSAVMSFAGDYSQVRYYIFDFVASEAGFHDRYRTYVTQAYNAAREAGLPVELVPQVTIRDQTELDIYTALCLEAGYEGVILRDPAGRYKHGRSTAKEQIMLKIKPWEDAEGTIIGFEEGETNTNELERDHLGYAKRSSAQSGKIGNGSMGKAIVAISGWKSPTVSIGNGPGLTHVLRQEIWDNQDQWIGKVLKFKFQRVGSLDAPRIPQWLGLRHPDDTGDPEPQAIKDLGEFSL